MEGSGSEEVAIFQNYYTPYRHELFEELTRSGTNLLVIYAHLPSDEGRLWTAPLTSAYRNITCRYWRAGKIVMFAPPLRLLISRRLSHVVLLDNNPTNIPMIFWGVLFWIFGKRLTLWVEHIPDQRKSRGKLAYQKACTFILASLCKRIWAFSEMTQTYLRDLNIRRPVDRMYQAVCFTQNSAIMEAGARRGPMRKFGYLGSSAARKNVDTLIQAIQNISRSDVSLHLAGFSPPPEVSALSKCVWYGYVDGEEKERFFRTIDCLILPSLADPWGLVVNEALHRGVLCAVSENCGSSELVRKISDKLIFDTNIASVAQMLEYCISRTDVECSELRIKAKAYIDDYSMETAARVMREALAYPR